jgi:hypothetical protein
MLNRRREGVSKAVMDGGIPDTPDIGMQPLIGFEGPNWFGGGSTPS